ncbi:MAG: hypothetical protein WD601_10415 [Pseudohongiellaceae bacterium]
MQDGPTENVLAASHSGQTKAMKNQLLKIIFICSLLAALPAQASTVAQLSFAQLSKQAELIFQGTVTDVRQDQVQGLIYTYVRFEISELIKGDAPGRLLELRFLGGSSTEKQVRVADLVIPQKGETGIYFVESTARNLVNPLLGWSQGHFLIRQDDNGSQVVVPTTGAPENELTLLKEKVLADKLRNMKFSKSAIAKTLDPSGAGLSPEAFKTLIREQLE